MSSSLCYNFEIKIQQVYKRPLSEIKSERRYVFLAWIYIKRNLFLLFCILNLSFILKWGSDFELKLEMFAVGDYVA